jgi:methyl-accepting chemotaxis protein
MATVATDLGRNAVPSGVIMGDLAESIMRFRALQPSAILAPYAEQKALIAQQRIENLAEIQAEFLAYGPYIDNGEEKDTIIPVIQMAWKNYLAHDARLTGAGIDTAASGHIYNVELQQSFIRLRAALKADMVYSKRMATESSDNAGATFTKTLRTLVGGLSSRQGWRRRGRSGSTATSPSVSCVWQVSCASLPGATMPSTFPARHGPTRSARWRVGSTNVATA